MDYQTPIEETLATLHDLTKAGKVRYLGASSMFAWEFAKSLYLADQHGGHPGCIRYEAEFDRVCIDLLTYLSGSSQDTGYSIAVDSLGNAYVGGITAFPDFPVSSIALQQQLLGSADGFLSKLNPNARWKRL
jgi:hypothetical protein